MLCQWAKGIEVQVCDKSDFAIIIFVPYTDASETPVLVDRADVEMRDGVPQEARKVPDRAWVDRFEVSLGPGYLNGASARRMVNCDDAAQAIVVRKKITERVRRTFMREHEHAQ